MRRIYAVVGWGSGAEKRAFGVKSACFCILNRFFVEFASLLRSYLRWFLEKLIFLTKKCKFLTLIFQCFTKNLQKF